VSLANLPLEMTASNLCVFETNAEEPLPCELYAMKRGSFSTAATSKAGLLVIQFSIFQLF